VKIPTRRRQHGLRFNITPLIDVVFLLIIFFLAASHFARSESQIDVTLPEATHEEPAAAPQRLVITITPDGVLHVGSRSVEFASVDKMIVSGFAEHGNAFEVHIRMDRSVEYALTEPIIIACARAGVRNVSVPVLLK